MGFSLMEVPALLCSPAWVPGQSHLVCLLLSFPTAKCIQTQFYWILFEVSEEGAFPLLPGGP